MRYALLIYCDEDTAVSDGERERREGTVHRDPRRTAGTWRAIRPPSRARPGQPGEQPSAAPATDLSTLDHREAQDEYAARFY